MFRPLLAALTLVILSGGALANEPTFRKHAINAKSAYESAGVFDVDGDGDLDIVCGNQWYEGPTWTPHPVREFAKQGTYYNEFATIPMDVNGDGRTDFVTCSYFGKDISWVENPGDKNKEWPLHLIDTPGPSEVALGVDLTGDGKVDIFPNTVNVVVFYSLEKAGPEPKFKKYDFGTAAAGHGSGYGDVNGDGRVDLLTPKGWFESPAHPATETWTWHPVWNLGAPGIPIHARDIDGDGVADLVYGNGHAHGLLWMKGAKAADGARPGPAPMVIDNEVSSVHILRWADLNGDGKDDELVTGKRVYAHEKEDGDVEPSIIASYRYDRAARTWNRNLIYKSEPARNAPADISKRDAQKDFPPGTAGTGLDMVAIDLDHDGDLDLVCPGKSGLYWFENLGTK